MPRESRERAARIKVLGSGTEAAEESTKGEKLLTLSVIVFRSVSRNWGFGAPHLSLTKWRITKFDSLHRFHKALLASLLDYANAHEC